MLSVRIIWLCICLVWIVAEIQLSRRSKLDQQQDRLGERRSQTWLWLSVSSSLLFALLFKTLAWLPIPLDYLLRQVLGLLLCLGGLGLRYWAIIALGKFFSTHVLIIQQHELIVLGPYRWLRHPAYSGLLLALAGAGLAMGDWLALALMTVAPFYAFHARIAIEEKMLREKFGADYSAYAKNTYKLIPLLY
jgi:protein-S-isoprenylcysteine O-methyltransferase Ste14